MRKSWASSKRSRLKWGGALCARLSLPPPRTTPGIKRPREITSIIASCSASHRGSSCIGRGLPSIRILAFVVTRARIEALTLATPFIQKGALWCSLTMIPSNPISSA